MGKRGESRMSESAPKLSSDVEAERIVPPDFATKKYRVTRTNPCPVCDKPDHCLSDGSTWAICPRTESESRWKEAGWFHRLNHKPQRHRNPPARPVSRTAAARSDNGSAKYWPDEETAVASKHAPKILSGSLGDRIGIKPDIGPSRWGSGQRTSWSFWRSYVRAPSGHRGSGCRRGPC